MDHVEAQIDGHTILIDHADAHLLHTHPWRVLIAGSGKYYVSCNITQEGRHIRPRLHRLILPETDRIDFANGNQLDLRRLNLIPRRATISDEDRKTLFRRAMDGEAYTDLASEYNVSIGYVRWLVGQSPERKPRRRVGSKFLKEFLGEADYNWLCQRAADKKLSLSAAVRQIFHQTRERES